MLLIPCSQLAVALRHVSIWHEGFHRMGIRVSCSPFAYSQNVCMFQHQFEREWKSIDRRNSYIATKRTYVVNVLIYVLQCVRVIQILSFVMLFPGKTAKYSKCYSS